ncbi:TIGR04097 family integral membrane protein [Lachnospiraceae bacterium 2_1_46FAA]|nr:TIGR04097 family integral membrane protein [Lachnospiraceae bacterium 2_1_46FAA]
MGKKEKKESKGIWLLKALLAGYVVTGVLLMILALLLYKIDLDEQKVTMGIIATYVISTFTGGFIMGKLVEEQRFVWGLILGVIYFLLLFAVSFAVNHQLQSNGTNLITTLLLCAGGGMLGGMVS